MYGTLFTVLKERKNMDVFDKIAGYEKEKKDLRYISDMWKNTDEYKRLGVKIPKGVMFNGDPGIGKTLMAQCLVEATGCAFEKCTKDRAQDEFIVHLKELFKKAEDYAKSNNKPFIVFFDDMDKFAETSKDTENPEEYAILQSLLDSIKDYDVFFVATVNSCGAFPKSLIRNGRIDETFFISKPSTRDSEKVADYYLKKQNVNIKDVSGRYISQMAHSVSCAELESIINEAGMYAAFERSDCITKKHIDWAIMRIKFRINVSGKLERTYDKNNPNCREFAYHEAGHAAVALLSENYIPTILFTDDLKENSSFCYSHNKNEGSQYNNSIERVFIDFGGKAGASIGFGPLTLGSNLDLREAWKNLYWNVSKDCVEDLHMFNPIDNRDSLQGELFKDRLDATTEKMSNAYNFVVELLNLNRALLDALADRLMEKYFITADEISEIFEEYKSNHKVVTIRNLMATRSQTLASA